MKHFLTLLLFTLSTSLTLQAQQSVKDTLAKKLENYFFLERENIHVQFNKSTYTTNEQLWFKGYVFHRKKNLPFFASVNIQASLMDEAGNILESQLLYGNIGTFSGSFRLNENLSSGRYYVQFYTNWMNNFIEDESSVFEITVINTATGAGNAFAKADLAKINIDLFPEGGTFVSGVANSFGVRVSDCNHEPVAVNSLDIADASGKIIQKVQINKLGYGRFLLPENTGQGYKAVATIEGLKHEKPLPAPAARGITMEVNTMTAGKTMVIIKTNKPTLETLGNAPLFLVTHKDDQSGIYEINFKGQPEIKMAIENKDLFEGMNTLRVIDGSFSQLAERMVYKYPAEILKTELSVKQVADTINITGKINSPNMSLSISALPAASRSIDETNDIYGSIQILPYIKNQQKAWGKYYFTTLSKGKMYELDLFLQCQQSKYAWNNVISAPPKSSYTFDVGLTLKGTVPKAGGSIDYAKVRLYSLTSGIDETTDVDKDRNFEFKNIFVSDSAYVNFTLLRKGEKPKELVLMPQVLNGMRKYYKPYTPQHRCFVQGAVTNVPQGMPSFYQENINLEEVTINVNPLKYANSPGNGQLRGYKITEAQVNGYQNLLNFIKTYGGFNTNDRDGQVTIYSRTINTLNGAQSGPIVYIDNMQLLDLTMLRNILMSEVDEIYMSTHAIVPSVRNYMGIIKIYLKKGAKASNKNATPPIIVKNAFKKIPTFENVVYNSTDDEGFANFGVIDWKPIVVADENGNFSFSIPKTRQKTIKLLIEGYSIDGKFISEIKTITLP